MSLARSLHAPRRHALAPLFVAGKLLLLPVARTRRCRLRVTLFVAVTGSTGKTTTTRLLAAALAPLGPVRPATRGASQGRKVIAALLGTRRAHRTSIFELAAYGRKTLEEVLWAYEPDVGVVTAIGDDHVASFRSREAVAQEKAKLISGLPSTGLAVLNADDPLVLAMRAEAPCRVVLYGRSPDADVRAEKVSASFPERLSFTLVLGEERHRVQTRLCGELWLGAILAALATAISLGVPPSEAVRMVETVEPSPSRLSVLQTPAEVTFLRDDYKGTTSSLTPALEVLGSARAARKIAVIGRITDDRRKPRRVYAEAARKARANADHVLLVGEASRHAPGRSNGGLDSVTAIESVPEAIAFLRSFLRPGDLVLVKSTRRPEHLERLSLASVEDVRCRRADCRRLISCDDCRLLRRSA